jgi:hypothetical protein
MRITRNVILGLVLGCGLLTAPASVANADAYGCPGTRVGSYPVKTPQGTTWGYFHIYYDSSTGVNCAVTVKNTAGGYGTYGYTQATIVACYNTTPSDDCKEVDQGKTDRGYYLYYAGPVKVYAKDRCISGKGSIERAADGVNATTYTTLGNRAVHCG